MGIDKHEKERRKERLPPFVPVLINTLDQPAWRALSHGARMLYIALKRRYSIKLHNNGRIFLSQRNAAKELGSHHNEIARWFRELQHYGFIVMTAPGFLGVEGKGKAPRWRLTELGYMRDPPTRDYERWDGTKFKDQKIKSRAGEPARSVHESQHTNVPESHTFEDKSVREMAHIAKPSSVQENRHRTILPYIGATQPNAPFATASAEPVSALPTEPPESLPPDPTGIPPNPTEIPQPKPTEIPLRGATEILPSAPTELTPAKPNETTRHLRLLRTRPRLRDAGSGRRRPRLKPRFCS
jgi:hypothetical protein